ncbi:hypothetical protein F4703DRAFT_1951615 [Phycomyces blakesleeanus]
MRAAQTQTTQNVQKSKPENTKKTYESKQTTATTVQQPVLTLSVVYHQSMIQQLLPILTFPFSLMVIRIACVSSAQKEHVTPPATTSDSSDIDGDYGRGRRGGCGGSVSTVSLLNEAMKPNYMSLVDMPNTQLRDEQWDQMAVTFKRLLKLQDKWADSKKNFHSVQQTLNGTGVGGVMGEERWPYYNHVFEILRDDPSKNFGVNVESMVHDWHHRVTILMTSRAESSIAELQRNIKIAASASAVTSVELSLLSTSDTNIATATSNSRNSAGSSSRLPTRGTRQTREEYEAERDGMLFERLLGMYRESEEHIKKSCILSLLQ